MAFFKHLNLVLKHKFHVYRYSAKLHNRMRGFLHDFKKFTHTEFSRSIKYYSGDKSPTFKEREANGGYSLISVHHSNRNFHHWQAWVDYDKDCFVITPIAYKYILECAADMLSATRVYRKSKANLAASCIKYFKERQDHYLIHPQSKEFLIFVWSCFRYNSFKKINKKVLKQKYNELLAKYPRNIFIPYNAFSFDYLAVLS